MTFVIGPGGKDDTVFGAGPESALVVVPSEASPPEVAAPDADKGAVVEDEALGAPSDEAVVDDAVAEELLLASSLDAVPELPC